jgi:hypothetical protein
MVVGAKLVRFTVPRVPPVQTLFALDESGRLARLAAVAIFTREEDTISVLFVAVREDYVAGAANEGKKVAPRLLEQISSIASRTKGVRWLRLTYHPRDLRIAVRKA